MPRDGFTPMIYCNFIQVILQFANDEETFKHKLSGSRALKPKLNKNKNKFR